MGDNEAKPPQIMQISMFHPGAGPSSSSNPHQQASSSSQPPQLQPQVLLKPPPARQPPQNPNAPQAMNPQTPAYFQPITPTPVRLMVPNPKPSAPSTAPPTLENLRLVGTAQYRTLIAPPNADGTQRNVPQFTKIAPRGPVRYAMIQPGQAILTLPRSVQPRTLAGSTGQIQTVFQAVPFTTPQIKDPVVINTITFDRVIRPFTLQGKQGVPEGPPILQQEAPCKQNEPSSSSNQPTSSAADLLPPAVTIPPEHVGKAKRTASATESSSADNSGSESPESTPPRPKRMRKKIVEDDNDDDVLYPPKKSETSTSDFKPPVAYDYDQFLTEAMVKQKKNVLHHTIDGVEITELFHDDLDEFDNEKFRRVSAAVGLSYETPTKKSKSATTSRKCKSEVKKEPVESSAERSETDSTKRKMFFEKLFKQYIPKIPSSKKVEEDATTTPDESIELTPDSDFVYTQASLQNTETPTVPKELRRPRNLADETINTPPDATNDNAAVREQEDDEEPAAAEEAPEAAPEATTAPPPAANSPEIVAQPTTRPAARSDDELKVIAENCALEAAGCSVKQVPGGLPLKRLSQWTIEECQNWTQQVTNCDDYRSIFEREEIDGSVLVFVPYTEFAQLLNLRFGPAKKMEVALKVVKAYDSYFDNM